MRRQLLVFSLISLMLFSAFSVVFARGTPVKVGTKVSEKNIDLALTQPEVVKVGNYDWLKMPDCSYISTPGHPMLPIKSVVVKLPLNSNVTQIVAKIENVSLTEDYFIMPVLTPVQVGSTEPLNMSSPDQRIYGREELYPNEWYVYRIGNGLDPESNRRVQYVSFYFYPLRYLPTDRKVLLAQSVSFIITYTEPIEEPAAQESLKNLIISSDTLEPYANQLATYKNSTGISSRVVNLTWVYKNYGGIDRPEQIRNCIKGFVAAYGITYVTIFGDADQVPVRSVFVNDTEAGEPYVPTDLYYSDLDGTWDDNNDGIYADQRYDDVDGIPDVYVGRIPPSLTSYAQIAVDKIVGYQQQFNASESWTRRVVLAAGTGSGDGFSNPFGIAFPYLKNYTANININQDIVRLYEAYGNLSGNSMSSEINKGALFVNFAGHGDPGMWLFYWVIPGLMWNGYGSPEVQGLTNGFKLPVVTTMSCSTARFDDQECIGERFVLQPDGGAIAYFGATRIAYGWNDQWITTGLMGEIDWRIYQNFYEGWTRLGQMWGQTAKEYVQNHIWNYSSASRYDVKTLMEFVLLGDPTLRVYNPAFPETLNVPKEYPTIQSAINAAYDGDTVFVSSGTYYENVVVNKTISLLGENRDTTIIDDDSTWYVVEFQDVSDAQISNFTIQNGEDGICLYQTTNITISQNLIQNVRGSGILVMDSANALMKDNEIANNGRGVGSNGFVTDCVFAENNITGNSWGGLSGEDGFWLENSIIGNNIMYNQYFGICLYDYHAMGRSNSIVGNNISCNEGGILLYCSCQNNTISRNNISGNTGWGISLSSGPSNNSISGNTITDNWNGILMSTGLATCSKNSVVGNNIEANGGYGILLQEAIDNSLSGNNMTNNLYGVSLSALGWSETGSEGNIICENNIVGNSVYGIEVLNSSNNLIFHNNFLGLQSVSSQNSTNMWDNGYPAGGNYWSDYVDVDSFRGPDQDVEGSDGIWDHAYFIGVNNTDYYPLINPWVQQKTLAVRGMDNRIYYQCQSGEGWQNWMVLTGSTVDSPAVAMLGNQLHFVVRGSDGTSLWTGYLTNPTDSSSFSGWTPLSGATSSAPTLTSNGTVLCLVVRGIDNSIYYRYYSSGYSWGAWHAVPSGTTCDSPAAEMLGNDLHIVVRGMDQSSIWDTIVRYDGIVVRNWRPVFGATSSKLVLASSGGNNLYLVVRGMDSAIYYRNYTASTDSWRDWTSMPGATCDGPGATVVRNRLCVIVRGIDGNSLWCGDVDLEASNFLGWTSVSGATPSAPTLAS